MLIMDMLIAKIPSAKNNNFKSIKDFASSMSEAEDELSNTLKN